MAKVAMEDFIERVKHHRGKTFETLFKELHQGLVSNTNSIMETIEKDLQVLETYSCEALRLLKGPNDKYVPFPMYSSFFNHAGVLYALDKQKGSVMFEFWDLVSKIPDCEGTMIHQWRHSQPEEDTMCGKQFKQAKETLKTLLDEAPAIINTTRQLLKQEYTQVKINYDNMLESLKNLIKSCTAQEEKSSPIQKKKKQGKRNNARPRMENIDYVKFWHELFIIESQYKPKLNICLANCTYYDRIFRSLCGTISKLEDLHSIEKIKSQANKRKLENSNETLVELPDESSVQGSTLALFDNTNDVTMKENVDITRTIPMHILAVIFEYVPFQSALAFRLINKNFASLFHSILGNVWINLLYIVCGVGRECNYLPKIYMYLMYHPSVSAQEKLNLRVNMIECKTKKQLTQVKYRRLETIRKHAITDSLKFFIFLVDNIEPNTLEILKKLDMVFYLSVGLSPQLKILDQYYGQDATSKIKELVRDIVFDTSIRNLDSVCELMEQVKRVYLVSPIVGIFSNNIEYHILENYKFATFNTQKVDENCVVYYYITAIERQRKMSVLRYVMQIDEKEKKQEDLLLRGNSNYWVEVEFWKENVFNKTGLKNVHFRIIDLPFGSTNMGEIFHQKVVAGKWREYKP